MRNLLRPKITTFSSTFTSKKHDDVDTTISFFQGATIHLCPKNIHEVYPMIGPVSFHHLLMLQDSREYLTRCKFLVKIDTIHHPPHRHLFCAQIFAVASL
mmetsp:Transcript_39412/g.95309  ORF Transcript_39412/g.95309 Transcript_39412/m.95309 type:complete len:100 (-) Transcript_39412:300-599(-)